MKPTLQMLRSPNAAPSNNFVSATEPRSADTLKALSQRKAEVERALAQTRQQRRSGAISKAINRRVQELAGAAIGKPAEGVAGAAVVRVVGLLQDDDGGDNARGRNPGQASPLHMPLPGLDIEISFRQEVVTTATTDATGVALLPLPEDMKGTFEVRVLGTDGEVVAVRRGRKTDTNQPALLLEVTATKNLAAAVERGYVWTQAAKAARARGDALQAKLTAALDRQEAILTATLAQLDDAITACP